MPKSPTDTPLSAFWTALTSSGGSPDQPNDMTGQHFAGFSLRFWILAILAGIGTGIGAGLLMWLLEAVEHLCYSYNDGTLLDAVQRAPRSRRVWVVCVAGVVASAGVWALKRSSGGHGGELNGRIWFHSGRIAVVKTILQGAFSMVLVAMGASLGRESAPKQTGAAIASWLCRVGRLTPPETRLLAACGAGAGMAAVYNVPLGGALFSLEVLLGTLALPLIPVAVAVSVIATVTAWLFLPNGPTYAVPSYPVELSQMLWSAWFGPVAGLASVAFVRLVVALDGLKPKQGIAMTAPVAVFAALAVLSIWFPQLLGNGKDAAQLGFTGGLGVPLLFALAVLKPIATAACLGSGAPGGLFTPSVMFGSMLGGCFGGVWALLWPGAAPGSYALIGAAAVLAASMQAPVAALVLVVELTDTSVAMMAPMLVAVVGSSVVARRLDRRSVYTGRLHAGLQAAKAGTPAASAQFGFQRAPNGRTISVAASYPEVLDRFVLETERPIYAVDEETKLTGRIDPARAGHPDPLTAVLSSAAAGDLARRIEPLHLDLSEADALRRLRAEPMGELPVVDENGRFVGVAVQAGDSRG